MHSVWSDGSSSIQEMAKAGVARGYEYIAITDHSKDLKIARGIDEKQLFQQADEIAIVNESLRRANRTIRVLRSIEVNLTPRGEVDMDLASLAKLDIVLGCFHSALRKKEDQTDRYVAALRNHAIHILGHPRGRIYNFRDGLSADWAKVFAVASDGSAQPARSRHVVMGPGLRSNPNVHRAPKLLLESADRSRVGVVVVSKTLRNVRVCESADQLTSGNEVDENRIH